MNTLHTTLTALEAQLETQKNELVEYEKNVYEKQLETLRKKVSDFFLHINILNDIIFNGSNIVAKISDDRRTSNIELYYELPWSRSQDEEKLGTVELSWYGSRCKSTDTEHIQYLKNLGEIAHLLPMIEIEWHNWYKEYQEYSDAKIIYYSAIYTTERAITDTRNLIKEKDIEQYKKVGFKCDLKNFSDFKRNYDIKLGEIGDYEIVQTEAQLIFDFGYSKWDYAHIKGFEILKELKRGKMLVKIKYSNTSDEAEYELTPKFFEPFIQAAYNWQTVKADSLSEHAIQFYEKRATKKIAEVVE